MSEDFIPEGQDASIHDMLAARVSQNTRLVAQLKLLGHAPSPDLYIKTAIETIIDLMFGEDAEMLAHYHMQVEAAIGAKLEAAVASLMHEVQTVEPDGELHP